MARPRKDDPKSIRLAARFTEAEAEAVKARADQADIHVSDLLRAVVLHQPTPTRTRRKPRQPVKDNAVLVKLLAGLGRLNNRTNQLAKTANMGGWPHAKELNEALADIRSMRDALMPALGVTPGVTPRVAPVPPSPSKHFGGA